MSEWDVVSTAPKSEWDVVSTAPKEKPAAPVKEEPVYDVMGVPTGYTQPALPGPSKAVQEFERTEGPFGYAKEYGKGVAALAAGTPAELTVNLPSTIESLGRNIIGLIPKAYSSYKNIEPSEEDKKQLEKFTSETSIPRVGYGIPEASKYLFGEPKSDIAKGMRTAGEVLGVPSPFGAYAALRPGISIPSKLTRAIEDVGIAGERLAEKGKAALSAEETTAAERLKRFGLQPTETDKIQTLARGESKLAQPDTVQMFEAGNDAESTARKLAETKGAAAEKKLETVGGGAFKAYENVAKEKEATEPFGLSEQGKNLQKQLGVIISGGEGPLRTYGQKTIDIAKDIYKDLFGRLSSDISPKEIEAVASRLPKSSSQAVREIQAKNIILDRESRRPVDYKIVDDKLRELRQTEQSKQNEAATAIARERYASAGDMVEDALKTWVGEDVYPREIYKEAAKDKNAWQTRLGEVLRSKREIPYSAKTAEYEKPEVLSTLFESRSSTNFTKELLGEAETNALAERHAMNELRKKKTSADVDAWMKNSGNAFIYEIPGLSDKLKSYSSSILRREEEAAAVGALRKEAAGVPKETEKSRKIVEKSIRDLQEGLDSPTKLSDKWSKARENLEATGLYTTQELDNLGNEISVISKTADTQQRREDLQKVLTKMLFKYGGGGAGAYGVYETFFGNK